jgi:hypothetical protein
LIGRQTVVPFNLEALTLTEFLGRDDLLSFSSLDRYGATPFVGQKIFERRKQIGTKPPLLLPKPESVLPENRLPAKALPDVPPNLEFQKKERSG